MCFTEPEWKFLNDKHHEVRNSCRLPKIHKSMVIESAINTQNRDADLTMGYHEIKVHSIIRQSYALARTHFENSWYRYLDDCQKFLKVNLIKPERLLSILNQINNNIQFSMEKSQTRLTFLDIMISKSGAKIWMDIYYNPTDSKRYVPFTSNHPWHCLTYLPFSLARRICTIVENENVKEKRFKELKKTLLEQKYPKSLIEASILRAKEIPLEILRQSKTAKNEEITPFIITYNPNNPNVFPMIKQSFDNFQYSKTVSNIFPRKKLVNSMRQAPNLLKASLYQFKQINKTFWLKNSFNCESNDLI